MSSQTMGSEADGSEVGEVLREMETEGLGAAIERLPERTRYVLVRRYGLDERDPATLAELSEELNISRERVKQLQREGELETISWPRYARFANPCNA